MQLMPMIGYAIGAHPKTTLITTLSVVIPILSYFLWYPIIIETDLRRGFAQKNGASLREFQRFAEFYNVSVDEFEILAIMIKSKTDGILPLNMSAELCDDIARLDKFVTTLEINSAKYGNISFDEFRVYKGSINHAFNSFKIAYSIQNALSPHYDDSIVLSYPNSQVYGYTLPLTSNIFAAKINQNFREEGLATAIETVDAISLFYITRANGYIGKKRLQEWEIKLLQLSQLGNFSEHFHFMLYGDQLANYEAEKGHLRTISMLVVGVLLMITYMGYIMRALPRKTQMVLAFTAICSPLLACLTSFALIGWMGLSYNSVMSLTPLLVLGIGVDDAFLLIYTWNKNSALSKHYPLVTAQNHPAYRMQMTIQQIGPSITITSLTNALAFSVGTLSPARCMSLFCVCTAMAMLLDFIFELTLFSPFLVITSRWENKDTKSNTTSAIPSLWLNYSRLILSRLGQVMVVTVMITLYIATFFGIRQMQTTFDASKTFPSDSPLKKCVELVDVIYKQYAPINFLVTNPPDFTESKEVTKFMGMIEELESRPEAYGRERTLFWLFGYIEYCRNEHGVEMAPNARNYSISLRYLDEFANSPLISDQNVVKYHRNELGDIVVDSFLVIVIYKGDEGWQSRARRASEIRESLRDYPQYNVTLFNYDSTIFDIINAVKKELTKAVVITLCCMSVVCFIFVPSIINTFLATLSILSISCSLLGMLSWWNLDMDPITMVNVLMGIGFSVDFSAHICYHFHKSQLITTTSKTEYSSSQQHENAKVLRLANVFNAVASPVIEAAMSTLLCIVPLFTINSYVMRAFAKTISVVCLLGIIHGLFILPLILSLQPIRTDNDNTNKNNSIIKTNQHSRNHIKKPILITLKDANAGITAENAVML